MLCASPFLRRAKPICLPTIFVLQLNIETASLRSLIKRADFAPKRLWCSLYYRYPSLLFRVCAQKPFDDRFFPTVPSHPSRSLTGWPMAHSLSDTPALGELEIRVLEHLWASGETSAKDMHNHISQERSASANSVQSAMERLFRKGLLSRRKSSHRYLYKAEICKADLLGNLINDLVTRFQADSIPSAAAILNAAERIDDKALDLLEAEIQRRRAERNR